MLVNSTGKVNTGEIGERCLGSKLYRALISVLISFPTSHAVLYFCGFPRIPFIDFRFRSFCVFPHWFCMVPSFPELFTDDGGSVLVFFQSDVKGFGGFTDVVSYVLM